MFLAVSFLCLSPKKTVDVDPVATFCFLLQDRAVRSSGTVVVVVCSCDCLADVVEENIGYFALHLVAEPLYDMI